ncbi:MAG: NAD(P)-dependent oxidoreductase [Deltaproteobacteria bacterium]|nr:NAD(P)-dependent oxidoreductase [Deltaproteobacteria bacterium]
MKTLITGATGFIGKHLARTLVEQGRDVRCLVRKTSDTQYLEKLGVELFYGDLLNKNSLKGIVKGVDIVHHLAGEVYSPRSGNYFKINVEGTENLLESCRSENIERFIFLSSIQATGPSQKQGILLNERSTCKPITSYGKSKLEAEKLIYKRYKASAFPTVIIRAPMVYGPGSFKCRSAALFQRINKSNFRLIGKNDHLISTCYIDNLIHGILLAERHKNAVGKSYFIADQKAHTLLELSNTIAKELTVKLPIGRAPVSVAYLITMLLLIPNKIFNFSRLFSWDTMREITNAWACNISCIESELGYKPSIDFNEGIRTTALWFKKTGSDSFK